MVPGLQPALGCQSRGIVASVWYAQCLGSTTEMAPHTHPVHGDRAGFPGDRMASLLGRDPGIFPHRFLQRAQRLIGNRKTAAIGAAGPDGEAASEPALRFSFLLTQDLS